MLVAGGLKKCFLVILAPVFPVYCQTCATGFMTVRGWLLDIFWCVYAVFPDFLVH